MNKARPKLRFIVAIVGHCGQFVFSINGTVQMSWSLRQSMMMLLGTTMVYGDEMKMDKYYSGWCSLQIWDIIVNMNIDEYGIWNMEYMELHWVLGWTTSYLRGCR